MDTNQTPVRRIIFYLPANLTHHSNVQPENRLKMLHEKAGIYYIGKSGVNVVTSFQGVDADVFPEIIELTEAYENIQLAYAPYSHSLALNSTPSKQKQWENANGYQGNILVSFFPEFCNPKTKFIPTEYFFVLATIRNGNKTQHVSFTKNQINLKGLRSINVKGKIGLMMHGEWFDWFTNAWNRFQRDPITADNSTNNLPPLDWFIEKIRRFAFDTDDPEFKDIPLGDIIIPLDLEAPYVGSILGAVAYEKFFTAITNNNLSLVFTGFNEDNLKFFKDEAYELDSVPERILGPKWTGHQTLLKEFKQMCELSKKKGTYSNSLMLFSLAFPSDLFSALNSYLTAVDGLPTFICRDYEGNEKKVTIGYDDHVINICKIIKKGLKKSMSPNGAGIANAVRWTQRKIEKHYSASFSTIPRRIAGILNSYAVINRR